MNTTAPSGVVTFLFTDIEGSTRRWEADADAMRSALAAHDEVLREAVETHDGWLFKHTGDGVCAAFAFAAVTPSMPRSPRSAALELPVRMGIATGEAELARRRLLRRGPQSRCAGDVRRPRRSDPARRRDGGTADRRRRSLI